MRNVRLLLVDDDPWMRKLLRLHLRPLEWEVVEAATGDEALARADEAWDAVLLDLILPNHGGFRVCQRLRERGDRNGPFIAMMTADDSPDTREMARACGADEFLPKPFDPAAVVERLASALALRRRR